MTKLYVGNLPFSANEETVRALFAEGGKSALRKELRKRPLEFVRLLGLAPDPSKPAPATVLSEEEIDLKVVGLVRALDADRLERLLARAQEPSETR
jgi:RNA recognition motif-containing protein